MAMARLSGPEERRGGPAQQINLLANLLRQFRGQQSAAFPGRSTTFEPPGLGQALTPPAPGGPVARTSPVQPAPPAPPVAMTRPEARPVARPVRPAGVAPAGSMPMAAPMAAPMPAPAPRPVNRELAGTMDDPAFMSFLQFLMRRGGDIGASGLSDIAAGGGIGAQAGLGGDRGFGRA